jgi:hypothetical protein
VKITRQEIKKEFSSEFDKALTYYTVLFALGGFELRPSELNLVAFSALKGTISTPPVKKEFMEKFNYSAAFTNNLISALKKKRIIVKGIDNKNRIAPSLVIDFKKPTLLNIFIDVRSEEPTEDNEGSS